MSVYVPGRTLVPRLPLLLRRPDDRVLAVHLLQDHVRVPLEPGHELGKLPDVEGPADVEICEKNKAGGLTDSGKKENSGHSTRVHNLSFQMLAKKVFFNVTQSGSR